MLGETPAFFKMKLLNKFWSWYLFWNKKAQEIKNKSQWGKM